MNICEAVIELINYSLNGQMPIKYRGLVTRRHTFGLPFIEPIEMVLNPRKIFINTKNFKDDTQKLCAIFTEILTEINKNFCGADKCFPINIYSNLGVQQLMNEKFKIHETNSSMIWTKDNPTMKIEILLGISKFLAIEFVNIETDIVPLDTVIIN